MNKYFSFDERKEFERLYTANKSVNELAQHFGRHLASIYREIEKGTTNELDENGRFKYSAIKAQNVHNENLHRRGNRKDSNK